MFYFKTSFAECVNKRLYTIDGRYRGCQVALDTKKVSTYGIQRVPNEKECNSYCKKYYNFYVLRRTKSPPECEISQNTPATPIMPMVANLSKIVGANIDRKDPIDETEWLRRSAMYDLNCPPATGTIYRGVFNNQVSVQQIIRNMLGDVTAEIPSWNFSELVKRRYGSYPTAEQWIEAKNIALDELEQTRSSYIKTPNEDCQFAIDAMNHTLGSLNIPLEDRRQAIGNASTPQLDFASNYSQGKQHGSGNSIIGKDSIPIVLVINEKIP